jgi:hypothetical protein
MLMSSFDSQIEQKLPHPQCSDDEFGEKVWQWCLNAMKNADAE